MTFEGCNINPKLLEIQKILLDEIGRDENGRGIIFVRTRLLAMYLIKWMKSTDALSDLNPTTFVGQNAPSDLGGKKEFKGASVMNWTCSSHNGTHPVMDSEDVRGFA